MGYKKFKTDALKFPRRRSKTAGTGTGEITTTMIRVQLDSKTIIFCNSPEHAEKARKRWAKKQEADQKTLRLLDPNSPSMTKEYKRNYAKEKTKQNRERNQRKKDMGPF